MNLWSVFSLLFVSLVPGASFDCSKAKTPIEKTVCSDPNLSATDDRLNQAYQNALKKAGEGDILVRHEQRAWLADLQDQCQGAEIRACLEQHEEDRIGKLNATPAFRSVGLTEYKITQASRYFDFTIRMFAKSADAGDDTREGPGRVLVYKKGGTTPLQTIVMNNIFVSLDKKGQPLIDSANLYAYQGAVNVGDFNFDGHEDFAIQNGNVGSYNGPSYDVYLYSQSVNRFEFSKAMSELIAGSLGFFQVDSAKKLLTTFSKEGCCYHETVSYAVVNNKPVAILREIDDRVKNQERTERLVNGKWKINTRHLPPDKEQ